MAICTHGSDAELADRVGDGDEAAFRELHACHHRRLVGLAERLLGHVGADCEGAVQDAWVRAHRALQAGKRPKSVGGWLTAIVRNVCFDELDRMAARPRTSRHAVELDALHNANTADPVDAVVVRAAHAGSRQGDRSAAMTRRVVAAALAVAAAGGGVALGAEVVPQRTEDTAPTAVHRIEVRALYAPTGELADLRRVETWRAGARERRIDTVLATGASSQTVSGADDVDRRAARLRSALELGWMRRAGSIEIAGRRALVLRTRSASPIERGWTIAVDPRSFAPIAGERRAAGRVVERRRLVLDERVPLASASLSRARSVRPGDSDHERSSMTNRTRVTRALATLAAAGALTGSQAASASAAPKSAAIHHWVIEHETMTGEVGRTEGWQRGSDRHVRVGDPGGPGFPWCGPGPQDWLRLGDVSSICGRTYRRSRSARMVPRQIANPTELGQVVRDGIERGSYEAAGEDVIGGRRVTVWREANRAGFEPEDERKLTLTTYYLDAADGSFVAERHDDVASGKTQEKRVVVDEVVRATAARLARAGLLERR